ncbi:hypothetical protein, partial [Seonamhaeicola sp.]|uniref:hypothetical protein n=1 Tax=Seonamhaeicola sp. TaxID=1912245 RepID=UPI003566C696
MKKILLTIIAPTILTFSCKQEPKPVINYAILTGKIENVKDTNIKINSKYTSISLDTVPTIQQTVNIDKTGAFIDTLFINSSREFSISLGKEFIVFTSKPGQRIELTADGNDFRNSIQFGGDEAAINTYLNKKESIRTRINNEDRHLKYGDETSFIKKQENKEKEFLNLLNSSQGLP